MPSETIDCSAYFVSPGFVNLHAHTAMNIFKGIAEDVPETENLRAYLDGEFWGIMRRDEDLLVWKALIAPEQRR